MNFKASLTILFCLMFGGAAGAATLQGGTTSATVLKSVQVGTATYDLTFVDANANTFDLAYGAGTIPEVFQL